jgi:hypothetical protein
LSAAIGENQRTVIVHQKYKQLKQSLMEHSSTTIDENLLYIKNKHFHKASWKMRVLQLMETIKIKHPTLVHCAYGI